MWEGFNMVVVRVLVYGGKGVFGVICVIYFKFKDWVRKNNIFSLVIFIGGK